MKSKKSMFSGTTSKSKNRSKSTRKKLKVIEKLKELTNKNKTCCHKTLSKQIQCIDFNDHHDTYQEIFETSQTIHVDLEKLQTIEKTMKTSSKLNSGVHSPKSSAKTSQKKSRRKSANSFNKNPKGSTFKQRNDWESNVHDRVRKMCTEERKFARDTANWTSYMELGEKYLG